MICRILTACLLAALPVPAFADGPTKAELEGRNLARELIEQPPAESSTLTGVLRIRHSKSRSSEVPVRCRIASTETNWQTIYENVAGDKFHH